MSRKIFRIFFIMCTIVVIVTMVLIALFTVPEQVATSSDKCGPAQCHNHGACAIDGVCWCTWSLYESETQCETLNPIGVVAMIILLLFSLYSIWSLKNWHYFTKEIKTLKHLRKVREEDYQRNCFRQQKEHEP